MSTKAASKASTKPAPEEKKKLSTTILSVLQRIGKSFMLPIAVLPAAGILLGLGSSLTNEVTIASLGLQDALGPGTLANSLLVVMKDVGSGIFDNLALIFALGIALGMAKAERGVAALSAAIAFLVMNEAISSLLTINGIVLEDGTVAPGVLDGTVTTVLGIPSLQMGVFGGIIVGLGVAALHNKFYRIELPDIFSFFGGTRFVPIISTFVFLFVGVVCYYIWPPIQNGIYALGGLVTGTGYFGTLIFGLIKRALIPFGLHHVFYMPFWQTAVGGTMEVAGEMVAGGQNIFFAQLADAANITHFSSDATRYFSGEFIFMIFGLPGAALAMYRCAKPEKRKAAGGLLLSAALTSMLTGITEPIEFSFLFVAPLLFVVHVVIAGAAYMIAHMLNIAVGLTFSGGFLDLFFFGILQGNDKTSWILIVLVGLVYFALYYFIFTFLIRKFNFKTPGREDDEEVTLHTKADCTEKRLETKEKRAAIGKGSSRGAAIVKALGGAANITELDCCATRLRVMVHNSELVDKELLRVTGANGVLIKGCAAQVIYGPKVTIIKIEVEEYLQALAHHEISENVDKPITIQADESKCAADTTADTTNITTAFTSAAGTTVCHGDSLVFPANASVTHDKASSTNISEKAECTHVIADELGIHARPAGELAQLLGNFESEVAIRANGKVAHGTSLVELMALGATQGTELTIEAVGPDAQKAIQATQAFLTEKM